MRKLFKSFVAVCAFLFASTAYGQLSQRLPAIVISGSGRPVAGAQIFVCAGTVTPNFSANPPCTLASIFSDVAGQNAITQPLLSDGLGNYTWFAAQGNYTEVVMARGIQSYSVPITIGGASGSGNVVGPNLSVSTDLPTFSDTTGKVLGDSGIAVTKAALKPVTSDAVRFVGVAGNDSNDGLSMGSPKLTLEGAESSLPAGGGTIQMLCGTFNRSATFTATVYTVIKGCDALKDDFNVGTGVGQLTTIKYTGTGTALNSDFLIKAEGISLQGSGSGTGVNLDSADVLFDGMNISNFSTGVLFNSNSFLINIRDSAIHDNTKNVDTNPAGIDMGESVAFDRDLITSKGSGFSTTCVDIENAGFELSVNDTSFDQCGMTVSGANAVVTFTGAHWENPNGVTAADFLTVSGSQALAHLFGGSGVEDGTSTGRTEFFSVTGTAAEITMVGGEYTAFETVPQLVNATGSDSSTNLLGVFKVNFTNFVSGAGGGNFSGITQSRGTFDVGGGVAAQFHLSVASPIFQSQSANPAQSGILRCADGDICAAWRNHAGTADVGFSKDTSDNLKFNGNFLPPLTGTVVGGRCVQDVLTGSVVTYVEAANPCGTGGTGSPGGSANQLQFNSAGAFGGIAGSTATANGGISFFPAADTPGLAVHPFATAISDPFQVFAETAVSVPSTPSLGQVAGGTLGSRTDFVQIAYAGYSGVFTTYSAQAPGKAVSVNNLLTVTSPSATTGAAGWLPAIASTTGGETNLETVTSANCTLATGLPENAPAMCAIGANWVEPTTGFNASGPAKPASNLTQVKAFSVDSSGNIHCQNCTVPVSNGFTASAAQPIGVDSTTGLFHSWTGGADAVDTQKAGAWTAGDCLKANDTVGGIADSGPCGAGGGGSSAWSALTASVANLTLPMGGFTSEFDQTSAVDKTFFLNNTTPATISTTNQSPKFDFGINDWVSSASTPESVSLSAKQEVAGSNIVSLLLNSSQTASGTQVDFTAASTNFVNNDWEFNGVKLTPTSTGSASSKVIGGYLGTGTNVSGANFDYQCDIGTGNTLPCDQVLQSGTFSTTSGTTRQTSVNRFVPAHYISGLSTGVAATIDTVTMGAGQPISFKYTVTVVATDGTNSCTAQGTFSVSGTDTAGTIVANVSSLAETSTACTSGDTLSFTAAASAASPMVVSVTPTLAGITPTSFVAIVELHGYSTIGDTLP